MKIPRTSEAIFWINNFIKNGGQTLTFEPFFNDLTIKVLVVFKTDLIDLKLQTYT